MYPINPAPEGLKYNLGSIPANKDHVKDENNNPMYKELKTIYEMKNVEYLQEDLKNGRKTVNKGTVRFAVSSKGNMEHMEQPIPRSTHFFAVPDGEDENKGRDEKAESRREQIIQRLGRPRPG